MTDSERKRLEEILPAESATGRALRNAGMTPRGSGLDEIGDMALIEEFLIGSDLDFSAGRDLDWALPEFLDDEFDMLAEAIEGLDPSIELGAESAQSGAARAMSRQGAVLDSPADRRAALDEILALPEPALLRVRETVTDRNALDAILGPAPSPVEVAPAPMPQTVEATFEPLVDAVRAEPDPVPTAPPAPPAPRDGFLRGLMRRAGIGLGDAAAAPPTATSVPHIRRN